MKIRGFLWLAEVLAAGVVFTDARSMHSDEKAACIEFCRTSLRRSPTQVEAHGIHVLDDIVI